MANDFWVDQSDPPYPAIRHTSHSEFDSSHHEVVSLSTARRRIMEICRDHRNHWLAVMNHQVDQSREAIIKEATESKRFG